MSDYTNDGPTSGPGHIVAQPVELLSLTAARVDGEVKLLMTIRPSPGESFASVTLAFTQEQAGRLLTDMMLVSGAAQAVSRAAEDADGAERDAA